MPDIYLNFEKMKIPHVCTVHTMIQTQMEGIKASKESFFKLSMVEKCTYLAYPYIACMQRRYLKKTKHLIAVSHMMKKKLEDYGFKGDITVIHNGIGKDKFEKPTRFEYKLPKKKNILYVGRLLHQKGIDTFVKLMHELTDDKYHFVICGQGGDFEKLIKKYQIPSSRYTYLGYVPNQKLRQVYAQAYALVLPSYFENLPITLLEAMAQGVPCIATDVGGVGEIIQDGKTGFLVKKGDVEGIKKKLIGLNNIVKRSQLIAAAHTKIVQDFTSIEMAKKTIRNYRQIIKGSIIHNS
jgi:glycosyltransferase involved in cell wall biosynthesis